MPTIYALTDPRTNEVRYIGKAVDVGRRLRRHLKDARDGRADHKSRWIASLLREDLIPLVLVLDECDDTIWKVRECYWIAHYRARGVDLTNCKDGGDGLEPDAVTRAKMRAAKLGKPAHNRGKSPGNETRKKQSEAARRKFAAMTPEQRQAAIARAQEVSPRKGHPQTEETRAKISRALQGNTRTKGRKVPPEEVERRRQSLIGHSVSEETRRKISEAKRKKHAERNQKSS